MGGDEETVSRCAASPAWRACAWAGASRATGVDAGAGAPGGTAGQPKRLGLRRLRQLWPDPAPQPLTYVVWSTLARPQDAARQGGGDAIAGVVGGAGRRCGPL
ncbi:hypothetical protein XAP6164_5490004 [Xanthomonas phaseoli pv. phaseoli]|nr:hypothetical protein XAP6164_5490004 [Xanthomonas phaseoli pv. phaseoli]